jgi:hypothetical protein
MLKVKVPIIFSGTQGFPLRRGGRYPAVFVAHYQSLYSYTYVLSAVSSIYDIGKVHVSRNLPMARRSTYPRKSEAY